MFSLSTYADRNVSVFIKAKEVGKLRTNAMSQLAVGQFTFSKFRWEESLLLFVLGC